MDAELVVVQLALQWRFLDHGVCNLLTVFSKNNVYAQHSQNVAHTVVQKRHCILDC